MKPPKPDRPIARSPTIARVLVSMLAAAAVAATPVAAQAKPRNIAPPGNSAIGQYVESIPTAKGNRPASTITPGGPGTGGSTGSGSGSSSSSGSSGSGGSLRSAASQRAFAKHGAIGKQAAALASEATAGGSVAPAHPTASGASGGSSPLATLVKAATGSSSGGGLGATLPIVLVLVAVVGVGLGIRSRRTTT